MNSQLTTGPQRYSGIIIAVHGREQNDSFCWIEAASVMKIDGSASGLDTPEDIYLHGSDSSYPLQKGREVEFEARPDTKRGGNTFRAFDASQISDEALLGRLVGGGIILDVQGVGEGRTLEQPSVFVSWCFAGSLNDRLKEHCLETGRVAMLLIQSGHVNAVGSFYPAADRQLAQVDDPMAAVTFRHAGTNRIIATVVFDESERELQSLYLSRQGANRYDCDVMKYGDLVFVDRDLLGSGCVEVEVPRELFAKKPWDWRWVNGWFDLMPRDQCAFRKRRIVAYPLQLSRFLFGGLKWLTALCIVALLLSVGMRGIDYTALRHPLDERLRDMWRRWRMGSFFVPKVRGWSFPFPLVVSPAFLGVSCATWFFSDRLGAVAAGLGAMLLGLALGLAMLSLVSLLFSFIKQPLLELLIKQPLLLELRQEEARNLRSRQLSARLEATSCVHAAERTPDVTRLPLTPRTFRFHAAAWKRRVCRGFEG